MIITRLAARAPALQPTGAMQKRYRRSAWHGNLGGRLRVEGFDLRGRGASEPAAIVSVMREIITIMMMMIML